MEFDFDSKVKTLREYEEMLEELEVLIESVKDEIKYNMDRLETDTVCGDDWKVIWKPVTTTRFDSVKFKREMPDMYSDYTKTSTCMRFILH